MATDYLLKIENGIEACKTAAKELLDILKLPIDSNDDKIKIGTQTKKRTAIVYFEILKRFKTNTDRLILIHQKDGDKAAEKLTRDLFETLEEYYIDGVEAINEALELLLVALERRTPENMPVDRLANFVESKMVAANDYFFLIEFVEAKQNEIETLKVVIDPDDKNEDEEEIPDFNYEELTIGYAEKYAR